MDLENNRKFCLKESRTRELLPSGEMKWASDITIDLLQVEMTFVLWVKNLSNWTWYEDFFCMGPGIDLYSFLYGAVSSHDAQTLQSKCFRTVIYALVVGYVQKCQKVEVQVWKMDVKLAWVRRTLHVFPVDVEVECFVSFILQLLTIAWIYSYSWSGKPSCVGEQMSTSWLSVQPLKLGSRTRGNWWPVKSTLFSVIYGRDVHKALYINPILGSGGGWNLGGCGSQYKRQLVYWVISSQIFGVTRPSSQLLPRLCKRVHLLNSNIKYYQSSHITDILKVRWMIMYSKFGANNN